VGDIGALFFPPTRDRGRKGARGHVAKYNYEARMGSHIQSRHLTEIKRLYLFIRRATTRF
jgi:hypothetical protein